MGTNLTWPHSGTPGRRWTLTVHRAWLSVGRDDTFETGIAFARICVLVKVRGFLLDAGWH